MADPAAAPHIKLQRTQRWNKGGRPEKLSIAIIDKVAALLRTGSYRETAVIAAGVSKQTFHSWLRRANDILDEIAKDATRADRLEPAERLLLRFLDTVEKAEADAELSDLITIKRAAQTQWQAAAWKLERKNPTRWARREQLTAELSGPNKGPIITAELALSDAAQQAILDRHMKRMQEENGTEPESEPESSAAGQTGDAATASA